MNGICGLQPEMLFASYDRDGRYWKTCRDLHRTPKKKSVKKANVLFTKETGRRTNSSSRGVILDEYWETWPKQGMMQNGRCWELTIAEPRIGGKGSGYWPTPVNYDATPGGPNNHYKGLGHMAKHRWSTPSTRDYKDGTVESCKNVPVNSLLGRQVHHDRQKVPKQGQLSPDWVEWLMNFPVRWTALEPIEELVWLDWSVDPADDGSIPRVATGIKDRVSRLKAIGNGQVPAVVAFAWWILRRYT